MLSKEAANGRHRQKSRIAARVRNINMILLIIVLVLISVIATIIVAGITEEASEELAFFYSLEAVEKFDSYMKRDLALVQKVACSKAVTEWFADEGDPEKKAAAYHEMMDYADLLQLAELYFGINGSLNEYSVSNGAALSDIAPYSTLGRGDPDNAWYYELIASDKDYVYNIDIDKLAHRWRIWINHKVISNDEVVGVFCSGLRIDTVLESMFARYDEKNVKGFIIDKNGVIQLNGANSDYYMKGETDYIQTESADPAFKNFIDSYLSDIDGYFVAGTNPEIIKLSKGAYGYASVAPINDSDWSVVTLFNKNSLFNISNFLPLVLALAVAFVLYVLANNSLTRRFVLLPLSRLTGSVSDSKEDESEIFGSDRDDEIGELARSIQKVWNQINDTAARLKAVVANYPGAICSADENFNITIFDGLLVPHLVDKDLFFAGQDLGVALQKDEFKHIMVNLKKTVDERAVQDWSFEANGKVLHMTSTPIYDDKGEPTGLVAKIEDITDMTKIQEELKAALERAETAMRVSEAAQVTSSAMFEANPQINILFDGRFKVIGCNPAAITFFNFDTKEELIAGLLERLINSIPAFQPDGRVSVPLSERLVTAVREGSVKFETELIMGSVTRNLNVEFKKIPYEDSFAIVGYVFDMTEIHEREVELARVYELNNRQIKKLNLAVKATKIGIWEMEVEKDDPVNPTNSFIWSNEFRQMLEYQNETDFPNILSSWSDLLHPDDKSRILDAFEKHLLDKTGNTPYDVEYRLLRKTGEYAYYHTSGETIRDEDGNPLYVAGALTDITETKNILLDTDRQRIEAEAANKAKSSFLSTMSHEIRTPMNAILGITEIQLQNNNLDQNARGALEKIYASGDMLLGIINDILDLSKIEAGKLELFPEKYEVASMINDTVTLNMMRIGSKSIDFELSVAENTLAVLKGDSLRIRQILNNLLSNAFKYTNKGVVRLSVFTETRDGSDDENETILVLSVSDTGQGMSKEQVERLFDEYSRFNVETNRSTEGTGLGMGITRNLIHMMNGEIFIESEPGKGSTFTVRIPQSKVSEEVLGREMAENLRQFRTSSRAQMKRVQITREPMPYGSVLIVDDVETNIYVARGLLMPYELKIDSAESGFAAIEKIKDGKIYDIIFMDHMMPKMDGVEATRIIRDMGYERPIVALTANAVSGQADIFLENGFDDYISKPIDIRQLNTVLNRLVRDRQPAEIIESARKNAETKKNKPESGDNAPDSGIDRKFSEVFARDALKALTVLEAISEKEDYTKEEDMRNYIINVHGMKSALANIGKMDLSATAFKLEMAGREGKLDIITSETPAFLYSLRAFAEDIAPREKEVIETSDEDRAYLLEKLDVIKTACEEYDDSVAEKALAELKKTIWSQQTAELLDKIAEQLLCSDFDEIVAEINRFKGEVT